MLLLLLSLTASGARLPAGTWFSAYYAGDVCEGCESPSFALLTHTTAASAREAMARVPASDGYPFVAHTEELGLDGDQLAVVSGLFTSRDEAAAWAANHPDSGAVTAVNPSRFAELTLPDSDSERGVKKAIEIETTTGAWTEEQLRVWRAGIPPDPVCTVPAGAIHIHPRRDWATHDLFVPVVCGVTKAYVPIHRTRMGAAVQRSGTSWSIRQTTDILDCDGGAQVDEWRWVAGRRVPNPKTYANEVWDDAKHVATGGGC